MSNFYTCPCCGYTSFNPEDAKEKYCGYCHLFEADMTYERLRLAKHSEHQQEGAEPA